MDAFHLTMTMLAVLVVGVMTGFALALRLKGGLPLVIGIGLVLTAAWAMSPCAIAVADGELYVLRRGWTPLHVPLASVERAERYDRSGVALRLFGVGGFFGSYGLYSASAIGRYRLYATRRGPGVLVRRKGGALPLVLTPDDVAGMIAAIDPSATPT